MRAACAAIALAVAAAAAPPVNPVNNRFLIIGDWGGQSDAPYTTDAEVAVAKAMGQFTKENPVDFVAALGDNAYDKGIPGDAHSPRFQETFEDVFTGDNLETVPWFVVLGNHDYEGNYTAEVAYTGLSKRWEMPDNYYSKTIKYANYSVQLVGIDTVELAGITEPDNAAAAPPGPADDSLASSQWSWIEAELKASTADILLVMGHYPVYSVCSHGPTAVLVALLKPMLERYGAHYMSGHDHCQEYASYNNVSYILSGAGHMCCYKATNVDKVPAGAMKWYHAASAEDPSPEEAAAAASARSSTPDAGFASIDMNATGFGVTFYNADLDKQYTTPWIPARSSSLVGEALARRSE